MVDLWWSVLLLIWQYFDEISTLAAVILAYFSVKEYKFIAWIVVVEFLSHLISYNYLFLDFRSTHTWTIYLIYMVIQVIILGAMYKNQAHFIIVGLIFINLGYNFLTILQHIGVTVINFHGPYMLVARAIMIFELLYLLGMSYYVAGYIRKNGPIKHGDIDYLDRLFSVRRNIISRGVV